VFVTAGEVMVELGGQRPLAQAESLWRSYSGDVLNIAVTIRRLGLPTAMLTKVGEDPLGDYLLAEWDRLGVDLRYVTRGGGPTGLYLGEYGPDGHYDIWYYRRGSAASTIGPDDIDAISLEGIKLVHLSGISQAISETSRAATHRLAERAKQAGLDVSYDVNYRHRVWSGAEAAAAMREVLPFVDMVFCGAPDESEIVTGHADPEAAAGYFLEQGLRVAAISMAADGARVAWPGGHVRLPHVARRVDVVQGAGDAFAGGFSTGWLLGADRETCARLGVLTASLKVERAGALLGLPMGHEVAERARELAWDDVAAALDRQPDAGGRPPPST
jgi:2-dehydro-3-deoxygluconokinase